jgi:hypothetical protein
VDLVADRRSSASRTRGANFSLVISVLAGAADDQVAHRVRGGVHDRVRDHRAG